MKKQTLCLIFGGNSREYEISLKSCACILKHINREKYEIYKIGITRDGKWYLYKGDENKIEGNKWESDLKLPLNASLTTGELTYYENGEKRIKPDIVFPIIHGDYGEDGRLRGLFDSMGLHCVGCPSSASVITLNKYVTKLIARENGVPVADFYIINKGDTWEKYVMERGKCLGYPLFVKAVDLGSSIGVYKVDKEEELIPRVHTALRYSDSVLLEREIRGAETEIALLEKNGKISFGKIGQIRHGGAFYGYSEKYADKGTELIIHAKISEECENKIREYAKRVFIATGCRGMCRADFFVTENEEVIFNEVNTVPGFTSGSMYPILMAEDGDVSGLIDLILA